jgi:hypothetical protein
MSDYIHILFKSAAYVLLTSGKPDLHYSKAPNNIAVIAIYICQGGYHND